MSYHAADTRTSHSVAEGDKRIEVQYLGATWRFASRESAQKFAADPPAYVPKYNGHCANALSLGEGLVKTDGSVWDDPHGTAQRTPWLQPALTSIHADIH